MDGTPRLEQLELSLLRSLDVLLETASVTEAARRLHTTQPAMSRTLARLREVFGDPLLVSVGRRMEVSARARALRPRVQDALAALRQVLLPLEAFSPERERSRVRIAASDYATLVVLRPWLQALHAAAPGIEVQVESLGVDAIGRMAQGELDLAVAPRILLPGAEQFVFRPLLEDAWTCVLRKGHPALRRPLTLERYLALEHLMVSTGTAAVGPVVRALERQEKRRRVVLTVPSFLLAPAMVAATDLCGTLPRRLVEGAGQPLVMREPPLALPPMELHLVWHPRWTSDPRHRWVREQLVRAAG